MPSGSANTAASGSFKLPDWGPPPLRKIHGMIASRINQITPVSGIGITCDQMPNGTQISEDESDSEDSDSTGSGSNSSGGSGTSNLYGADNGAPAIFHLKQSSAPTPV